MKRDELRWIPKKPGCEGGRRGFITVGLGEVKPATFLLFIGYGLSMLFFVAEILFSNSYIHCKNQDKWKDKRQHKIDKTNEPEEKSHRHRNHINLTIQNIY